MLEEIKTIRIEMENGREEVRNKIKNLESRIMRIEERWRVRKKDRK